jgi:hypothetical protein
LLLWKLVDRRDAGRHAVPGLGPLVAADAALAARARLQALVACDVVYVLDAQLVTRARGRAGRRRPAPPDRPGRRRREAPPPLRM